MNDEIEYDLPLHLIEARLNKVKLNIARYLLAGGKGRTQVRYFELVIRHRQLKLSVELRPMIIKANRLYEWLRSRNRQYVVKTGIDLKVLLDVYTYRKLFKRRQLQRVLPHEPLIREVLQAYAEQWFKVQRWKHELVVLERFLRFRDTDLHVVTSAILNQWQQTLLDKYIVYLHPAIGSVSISHTTIQGAMLVDYRANLTRNHQLIDAYTTLGFDEGDITDAIEALPDITFYSPPREWYFIRWNKSNNRYLRHCRFRQAVSQVSIQRTVDQLHNPDALCYNQHNNDITSKTIN
jgi:hypothetical protein